MLLGGHGAPLADLGGDHGGGEPDRRGQRHHGGRQVDGKVRSFVHSPVRALLIGVDRTAGAEGVV